MREFSDDEFVAKLEAWAIHQLDKFDPDAELTLGEALEQARSMLYRAGFRQKFVVIEGGVGYSENPEKI